MTALNDQESARLSTQTQQWLSTTNPDAHLSPLLAARQQFQQRLTEQLARSNHSPEERARRVAAGMVRFDEHVQESFVRGAAAGGRMADVPTGTARQPNPFRESVDSVIDMVAGNLGPLFQTAWSFAKRTPFIGSRLEYIADWIHDKAESRTDRQRRNNSRAAGAAIALGHLEYEGVVFDFAPHQAGVARQLARFDWGDAPPAHAPAGDSPAGGDSYQPLSPEVQNDARAAARPQPHVPPTVPTGHVEVPDGTPVTPPPALVGQPAPVLGVPGRP